MKKIIVVIFLLFYGMLNAQTYSWECYIASSVGAAMSIYTCDLDGYGDQDILSASSDEGTAAWYENIGNGYFSLDNVSGSFFSTSSVASDMDGDTDLDIVSCGVNNNRVSWFERLGTINCPHTNISDTICTGDSIWFNDQHIYSEGVYFDTIMGPQGCEILRLTLTVSQSTSFAIELNPVYCAGDATGSAYIMIGGGIEPYQFSWATGEQTDTAYQLVAGLNYLTITDAFGCSFQDAAWITSVVGISVFGIPTHETNGADGAIDLYVDGGSSPYTIQWNNGATNEDLFNLTAGTYCVTITDDKGCTETDCTTINSASGCSKTTATLNEWICDGNTYNFNGKQLFFPGTYLDTLLNSAGCDSIITLNLTVKVITPSINIDKHVSCNGASNGAAQAIVLQGEGPFTFLWSNGEPNSTATALSAGTHELTITDINGCQQVSQITITEPAAINASASAIDETNGGDGAIDLTVSGGTPNYTFTWSNGATTEDINNLVSGTYCVTIADTNNCEQTICKTISSGGGLNCASILAGGTDICTVIVDSQGNLDPTHPLATIDCDEGGISNYLECLSGEDPSVATDDCQTAMDESVDICALIGVGGNGSTSKLMITGVGDGSLFGGTPKFVELLVLEDINDLSDYGLEAVNNGVGTIGVEFHFPAISATAGNYLFVATETNRFNDWFGFPPDFQTLTININGDDAVALYQDNVVIDVFGEVTVDGTGTAWEYTDGFAYRKSNRTNTTNFDANDWNFSGVDAWDGETSNVTAASPFPDKTFVASLGSINPNHPLTSLDCDGGGIVNYIECLSGENPSDPADDCMAAIDESVDICAIIGQGGGTPSPKLVISGVGDGPLVGGTPKFVELHANQAIADLSEFGLEAVNNGAGSAGVEFTFPNVSVAAGTYIFVATEANKFNDWFGFPPDFITVSININGDDAVVLYENNAITDVFGEVNTDGTGTAWEYMDGFAYRKNNTSSTATFDLNDWTFSGIDVWDGETSNSTAAISFPTRTFIPSTGAPIHPLGLEDCDGDGVINATECSEGTDPSNFCFYNTISITEPVTANQSSCNSFDLSPVLSITPNTVSGISNISVVAELVELGGEVSDGTPIKARLPADPRLTFVYDTTLTNVGFYTVDNNDWTYSGSNGVVHEFTYVPTLFEADARSAFGFVGSYDQQGTDGVTTITLTVFPFSGGESELTNNTDAETLVYFD